MTCFLGRVEGLEGDTFEEEDPLTVEGIFEEEEAF